MAAIPWNWCPATWPFPCGVYRFAGDIGRGLVAALPPVLSLPASVDDPIHRVVTLLSREMLLAEPGKQTVLDRPCPWRILSMPARCCGKLSPP
jgi:hypothetical protein